MPCRTCRPAESLSSRSAARDRPEFPHFGTESGFEVNGLDYSLVGCEQARAILAHACVPGRILYGDLFAPPNELLGSQEVVITFGVVQHFADTAGCVRALARLMKPSGTLITIIPNLTGVLGTFSAGSTGESSICTYR